MSARAVLGGTGLLVAFVFLAAPLQAQENRWGLAAGVSRATWGGDDAGDPDTHVGFDFGAFVSRGLSDAWALRPGIYFVEKGIQDGDPSSDAELTLDYVEFPLLVEYRIPIGGAWGMHLLGGPAVAFEVGCEVDGSSDGEPLTLDCRAIGLATKDMDLGAMIGGGLHLDAGERLEIVLDVNYNLGLTSIDDSDAEGDVKNRAFQVNAGVSLPLGG